MINHVKAARLLFGGAGLLLIFSACSDRSSPVVGSAIANASTTVAGAAPASAAPAGSATTAAAGSASAPAPIDGGTLLQQGLAAINSGYHFNQTSTVDGAVVLTADGDRLPDGTRLTLTGEGGVVSYIITPDASYAQADGGEWQALDATPDAKDPILSLFSPTSVTVTSNDGTTVQLAVTVPIALLGLTGDGDAALQVSIVSGVLSNVTYTTTTSDGKAAAATTVISPVVDPSPVVAPI